MWVPRTRWYGKPPSRWLRWLGVTATIGNFVIIAMGDLVTNSGSAEGCGRSWPLCHGQFVPTFDAQTLIEFSHRAVVGIISFAVLGLAIGMLLRTPHRREVQVLAPGLVFFLFLQAILGAVAVLWPQSAAVLALHMGVSLLAFSTAFLSTVLLYEEGTIDHVRDLPIPISFRRRVWASMVFLYVVIYVGAFVRHGHAELACGGWPLCNGSLLPSLNYLVLVNLSHRVTVVVAVLLFASLWYSARRFRATRPDLYWGSVSSCLFLLLQGGAGALVPIFHMALWTALLHGTLMTPVFGAVAYLCLHVLPRPRAVREQRLSSTIRRNRWSIRTS